MPMPASPALAKHAPAVAKRLRDPAVEVRVAAAEAAEPIGGRELAAALAVALSDLMPVVRTAAALSLAHVCRPSWMYGADLKDPYWSDFLERELRPEEVPPYAAAVARLLDDPDGGVRAAAVISLRDLHDAQAYDRAVSMTADPDPRVKLAAIVVLRGTERAAAIMPLLRDPSPEVRSRAAEVAAFEGRHALVLPLLRDREPGVVVEALRHLAWAQDETVAERVRPLLGHADRDVRAAAVHAFAELDGAPTVLQPMLSDPEPRVRAAVANALTGRAEARALLKDASAEVRVAAVRSVGEDEGALRWLVERLADEHPDVRAEAAYAIVNRRDGPDRATRAAWIVGLLTDRHVDVRSAALRALGVWRAVQYRAEVRERLRDDEPLIVWQARLLLEEWEGAHDARTTEA